MSKADEVLNRALVLLRKIDEKMFSYGELGRIFGKNKKTIEEKVKRDWNKYDLEK